MRKPIVNGKVYCDPNDGGKLKYLIRKMNKKIFGCNRYTLKKYLMSMQDNVCFLCEQPFSFKRPATIDHLVPLSLGGSNHKNNLALVHDKCNNKRGNASWIAARYFFTHPEITKYWKRYLYSGYRPRFKEEQNEKINKG